MLAVQAPLFGGTCAPRAVGFGQDYPPLFESSGRPREDGCQILVSDLSAACQNYLTVAPNLSSQSVTSLALASTLQGGTSVPVSGVSFARLDSSSGARIPLAGPSLPTWDSAAGICRNVLSRAVIDVTYSIEAREIQAATATILYDDAEAAVDGSGVMRQEFVVRWMQGSETAVRYVSGSPGYIGGYPLRAGTEVVSGDRRAVSEFEAGLPFLGPAPDGSCSEAAASAAAFGRNASVTCWTPMTLAELNSMCQFPGAAPLPTRFLRGLFAPQG